MADTANSKLVVELAELLESHRGRDTIVLDIHEHNSWTDYFVITTATSSTHLKGLLKYVRKFLSDHKVEPYRGRRNVTEDGWALIDCGDFVVHIMSEKMRDFYELERLWFNGKVLFQSLKSS